MKKTVTLRILARALSYPDSELVAHCEELALLLREEDTFSTMVRDGLESLLLWLGNADRYEVEQAYVDSFDRSRSCSLHLFEHVHGDSRDRGQAMVDLLETYRQGGMVLTARELPDHLAVLLEFASTQPREVARNLLAEVAHILNAIHSALVRRNSPYAAVLAAIVELSGEPLQKIEPEAEPSVDEAWEEPPAFGACAAERRSTAGATQPVRFVARPRSMTGGMP